MRRKLLYMVILVLLVGCNPIEHYKEMQEKQAQFNELSKKEFGVEAQVGWSTHNGKLISVNVIYPFGSLSQYKVEEIEEKISTMVINTFKEDPTAVSIAFQKTRRNS